MPLPPLPAHPAPPPRHFERVAATVAFTAHYTFFYRCSFCHCVASRALAHCCSCCSVFARALYSRRLCVHSVLVHEQRVQVAIAPHRCRFATLLLVAAVPLLYGCSDVIQSSYLLPFALPVSLLQAREPAPKHTTTDSLLSRQSYGICHVQYNGRAGCCFLRSIQIFRTKARRRLYSAGAVVVVVVSSVLYAFRLLFLLFQRCPFAYARSIFGRRISTHRS